MLYHHLIPYAKIDTEKKQAAGHTTHRPNHHKIPSMKICLFMHMLRLPTRQICTCLHREFLLD